MRRWLFVTILAACGVNKQVHQKVVAENAQLKLDLEAAQKKQADTEKTLGDKIKSLETSNAELTDKIKTLENQVAELDATAKGKEATIATVKGQMTATQAELAELRRQKEAADKRIAAYKALQDKFRALVDTGKLQVVFRNGQMTLKLPSGILFASGSAELSKDGQKALSEVVAVLMQFKDRRFVVAGHTDNEPIRTAEFKNNWYLSTARANSVVQYMIKEKFPPKSLAAAGYGEFDPVAPNDKEPGREQNRRIEIILVPNLEELPSLTGATP